MGYLGDVSPPSTNPLTPVELDSGHSALTSVCQPCVGDDRIMHLVLDWDGGTAQQVLIGYADDEDAYTSKDFSVAIDRALWSMTTSAACSLSLTVIGGVHYLLALFTTGGTPGGTSDYTFDSSVTGTPGGINGNVLYSSSDDGASWVYLTTVKTCGPPAGLGQWVGINTEIAHVGSDWWACVSDPGSQNKVSGVYSADAGTTWANTASGIVNSGQRLLWGSRNWGSIGGVYFYSFGEDVIAFQRAVGITTTDDHGATYHNDTYEEYLFGSGGMPTPPGDQGWQHTYVNVGAADDVEVWRVYNSGQSVGVASTLIPTATISPAEWTVEAGPLHAEGFSAPWVVPLNLKTAYLWNNTILGGVIGWMVGHTLYAGGGTGGGGSTPPAYVYDVDSSTTDTDGLGISALTNPVEWDASGEVATPAGWAYTFPGSNAFSVTLSATYHLHIETTWPSPSSGTIGDIRMRLRDTSTSTDLDDTGAIAFTGAGQVLTFDGDYTLTAFDDLAVYITNGSGNIVNFIDVVATLHVESI